MTGRKGQLHTLARGTSGPRVAFLHGLFGRGRNWNAIAKGVSGPDGTDARCLLIDLPDHGRSPHSDSFSFTAYAQAVADTLREVGGNDTWTVVGHSLGGKTAMVLALSHGELVEQLVVVDIAPKSYGDLHRFGAYIETMRAIDLDRLERRAQAEDAMREVAPERSVRAFLLQNLRRHQRSWTWQANLELFCADAAKGAGSVIAGWPAEVAHCAAYEGPVLWIAGARSPYIDAGTDSESMRALFPKVRLLTVKEAGHWVHSERPRIVIGAIRRMVQRRR